MNQERKKAERRELIRRRNVLARRIEKEAAELADIYKGLISLAPLKQGQRVLYARAGKQHHIHTGIIKARHWNEEAGGYYYTVANELNPALEYDIKPNQERPTYGFDILVRFDQRKENAHTSEDWVRALQYKDRKAEA